MKKLALIILLLAIFQLSNTPNLRVAEPNTWANTAHYTGEKFNLEFIIDFHGDFYKKYKNILTEDFILHKLSHILFYSILSLLIYINFNKNTKITIILLFLFALSDEIHQHFIVGRSGRALDVCLDTLAGIISLQISKKLIKYKKNEIN